LVGLLYRRNRACRLPKENTAASHPSIDAEIDLITADDAFFLRARLNVSVPGVDPDLARTLVDAAHGICPYSKATRGSIDVKITLV
jgi:osmotically inducible protein OsmC